MGIGSKIKKAYRSVEKQVKRSTDQVYKQAIRSANDYTNMVVQSATGGTLAVRDGWKLGSGDVIGQAVTEVRDNWTKYRMPILVGAASIALGAGAGAALGALGVFGAGAGASAGAAAGTASGVASGTTAGGVAGAIAGAKTGLVAGIATGAGTSASTAYSEHVGREQERDAAAYAAEVERQQKAYDLASKIQSQEAYAVNPSAYYNIYRRYGR